MMILFDYQPEPELPSEFFTMADRWGTQAAMENRRKDLLMAAWNRAVEAEYYGEGQAS